MLTVSEAAKEVGITRGGIWKAIKQGRLSATKNNNGQFAIDPAELFRVYTAVDKVYVASEHQSTQVYEPSRQHEADELRIRLELTNKLLVKSESECDDLRKRLDQESAKVTMLLSHQPIAQEQTPMANEHGRREDSQLWRRLFGRRG